MTELATITPAELCARLQRPGVTLSPGTVRGWMRDGAARHRHRARPRPVRALAPLGLFLVRDLARGTDLVPRDLEAAA